MKTAIVHFAKTLLAITLLVPTVTLAQTTVYSYQSGNFADPNIWTFTNGGVDFVTTPLPTYNYVINPGHTITLTANSANCSYPFITNGNHQRNAEHSDFYHTNFWHSAWKRHFAH
jgi:hypothetical protein